MSGTSPEDVLGALEEALERLLSHRAGILIPEVRSNLGSAMPGARSHEDVAAVPGRITEHDGELLTCKPPCFGASRHIARVILAAMSRAPQLRAAMNIRSSPRILEACQRAGLTAASFSRADEPPEVKDREGKTLDWGTRRALVGLAEPTDLIVDDGDQGKEPMIRVLGESPAEVVGKVLALFRSLR